MKDIKEFSYKYDAQVRPSSQQWRRARPISYSLFQDQGMQAFDSMQYDTIPMVDITMPEDRFRALLEHDSWLEQLLNRQQYQDQYRGFTNDTLRITNIVKGHEREALLRHEHPAVQKAWERYQLLLQTVDQGR